MGNFQKYEVLRMIERDGQCHISMDCVEGTLLIYRVQKGDVIERNQLLGWMRQLVQQLDMFYRSGLAAQYRYLNPYSVLVTSDEQILLLDMEAASNEFVIRNMQKRAMRNHFLRPLMQMHDNSKLAADLYSLGKTIQFILASSSIRPSLTLLEEYRLALIIQKCLGEHPRKRYRDLAEILKELPKEKNDGVRKIIPVKPIVTIVLVCVIGLGAFYVGMHVNGAGEGGCVVSEMEGVAGQMINAEELPEITGEDVTVQESEMVILRNALSENTKEGNELVIQNGEILKGEILYLLATAYDREGQIETAIKTYGDLCNTQCEATILEQAYYRKAYLEKESQQVDAAIETCKKGMEYFPESEKLKELLGEMEVKETVDEVQESDEE